MSGEPALFLDFDGVLVDSNSIKVEAFFEVASKFFDTAAAVDLVEYHLQNPGESRFTKFAWLIRQKQKPGSVVTSADLVSQFSESVLSKVMSADRCDGLEGLLSGWRIPAHILSAAPTEELSHLVDIFGWRNIFEKRVHGSPTTKAEHLEKLSGKIDLEHSIFVGDAPSDFQVSKRFGIPFVFVENWSEWKPTSDIRTQFSGSWPTLENYLSCN